VLALVCADDPYSRHVPTSKVVFIYVVYGLLFSYGSDLYVCYPVFLQQQVDDFFYFGSYASFSGSCEKDVKVQIGKTPKLM